MTTLELSISIDFDGKHAADVTDDLAIDVDAGELDQAVINLLRAHLRRMGDFRDWRIVRCMVNVKEGEL